MNRIERATLMTLEAYAKARPEFRARVLSHKKNRTIALGPNVTLIFEDELTIRYQVQEMLRVEKTFEEEGIQDELEAYNPLIPDGTNWKATMMIEFPEIEEDKHTLSIYGLVDRPLRFTVADLKRMPSVSAVHFLECHANSSLAIHDQGNPNMGLPVQYIHGMTRQRMDRRPAVRADEGSRRQIHRHVAGQ